MGGTREREEEEERESNLVGREGGVVGETTINTTILYRSIKPGLLIIVVHSDSKILSPDLMFYIL